MVKLLLLARAEHRLHLLELVFVDDLHDQVLALAFLNRAHELLADVLKVVIEISVMDLTIFELS